MELNTENNFKHAKHNSPVSQNFNNMKTPIQNRANNSPQNKSFFKRHKIAIIILAVLLIIAALIAIIANVILNTSFEGEDVAEIHEHLDQSKPVNEPFYMLLVGSDTREKGDNYQYSDGRSDTCILVRVDANNCLATMVSIPRDTQIVYNGQVCKFNAAYNYGGISSTIDEVKKLCGVNISHYVEISFNGMNDMIDAIGGVELTIPENTVPNNNENNGGQMLSAGKQLLNGDQALAFVRSRKFADGDFTRTADQRLLLQALVSKVTQSSMSELPKFLETVIKYVRTDLTLKELLELASNIKGTGALKTYSAMVPSTTGSENGVSYVYTDYEALSRMMKMVDIGEDPSMLEVTSGASIGSSRDNAERLSKQQEYYAQHPNSPGRAL